MKYSGLSSALICAALVPLAGCGSGSGGNQSENDDNRFRITKEIRYDGVRNVLRQIDYIGCGDDKEWFTGDDTVGGYGVLNDGKTR